MDQMIQGVDVVHGGANWSNLLFDQANLTTIEETARQGGTSLYMWESRAVVNKARVETDPVTGRQYCHSPIARMGSRSACFTLSTAFYPHMVRRVVAPAAIATAKRMLIQHTE